MVVANCDGNGDGNRHCDTVKEKIAVGLYPDHDYDLDLDLDRDLNNHNGAGWDGSRGHGEDAL